MSTVIIVENIGKKYTLHHQQREQYTALRDIITNGVASLANMLIHPFRRKLDSHPSSFINSEDFWALKDVSFEVKQGDRIGIIGRNGAGKSTLLKILSRITEPTTGSVRIKGRVASLLEVGTGFHPELTGRENIFLNGAILGMGRAEIRKKFDEIVDFAEIEKFLDTPVKRYSSGMYVRLAFAVAAHLEPEILIVDEVLAVGDAQFQKKCLGKMEDVSAKEGRTVLFVSHNMATVRLLCPHSILLKSGCISKTGNTGEVINHYLTQANTSQVLGEVFFDEDLNKEFQVRQAKLLNYRNDVCQSFNADDEIVIELDCQANQLIPGLYGYMTLDRTDGTTVMESDSFDVLPNRLDNLPLGQYTIRIVIPPRTIGVGDYTVYFNFTSHLGVQNFYIDTPGHILSFRLDDPLTKRGNNRIGFLSTQLTWEIDSLRKR